jgi:hypothetical protein
MRRFAKETGTSKSSAAIATKLLKLWPYKAIVVHALQLHDPASRLISATGFSSQFMMMKLTPVSYQSN